MGDNLKQDADPLRTAIAVLEACRVEVRYDDRDSFLWQRGHEDAMDFALQVVRRLLSDGGENGG